ncbi:MAG: hypothetical protein A2Z15_01520 [Chloroflexi bacterium RBG_16_50_11]|nr:MAG: hypothetical protein A2Z15_01520 [Chloroflexi bacterium RBG_16_50_11]
MYTALVISYKKIRLLSLKGRRVKTWGELDLAEGLVRESQILQPQAVGEAINSLFKSTGISKDNVIVSIAGTSFTYRFIKLPRVKPSLLEETILRAAKKEISLPLDELYITWQAIPSKGEEQEYFILGVPRSPVDAAVQTLKIAGVESYLMELRPLALARAANRSEAIVVNMESDCFDIVFINHGLPVVIHTISPRSASATLEDNIHQLAGELIKTAAFYQSNHPDIQLGPSTPLLLAGELTAQDTAQKLLQAEIEYPIESLMPPVEYPDNLPVALYTAGIGVALKRTPLKPSGRGQTAHFFDINVNILTGKYRKPKAKPIPLRYLVLTAFLLAAVAGLYPLYQAYSDTATETMALEAALNNVQRELNLANLVYEETIQTEDMIYEIITAAEALKAANNSIFRTRGIFNTRVQKATDVMPLKTSFTSIELTKDSITIKGETDNIFTVIEYAAALEAAGVFTEVRITELDETLTTVPGADESEEPSPQIAVITFEIVAQLQAHPK